MAPGAEYFICEFDRHTEVRSGPMYEVQLGWISAPVTLSNITNSFLTFCMGAKLGL
jgi:hypothetical protein